jgi:uncharacterized protein (DUF488 family)
LKTHRIDAIGDVRSHPYSKFLPHFSRKMLQPYLEKEGIKYVFLGQELGARPDDRSCYIEGKAVYEKIAQTDAFQRGIEKLLKGLKKYRISLMCAEQDPLTCHRAILICQSLRHLDLEIDHILKNGDLETHHDLENRMLDKHGFNEFKENRTQPIQLSLFEQVEQTLPTREECLIEAYKLQGDKIAYVESQEPF